MINAKLSPIWKAYTHWGHVPFKFISILPGARSRCCLGEMSCRKLWPRLTLLWPSNCFLVSSNTHAFLENFLYHKGLLFVFLCSQSCLTLWPHGLQPTRLLCPWDSPGKNIGVSCHALLHGIFPTQGSNPRLLCLLHCRQILYCWSIREDNSLPTGIHQREECPVSAPSSPTLEGQYWAHYRSPGKGSGHPAVWVEVMILMRGRPGSRKLAAIYLQLFLLVSKILWFFFF